MLRSYFNGKDDLVERSYSADSCVSNLQSLWAHVKAADPEGQE